MWQWVWCIFLQAAPMNSSISIAKALHKIFVTAQGVTGNSPGGVGTRERVGCPLKTLLFSYFSHRLSSYNFLCFYTK